MWRVSSADGSRWVQHDDDGSVQAEPAGLLGVLFDAAAVEVAPLTGQWYQPRGERDPVAVFLRARTMVGGGLRITGRPPKVPAAGGPVQTDVVY